MMRPLGRRSGFTLLELMFVLAILVAVSAMVAQALPFVQGLVRDSNRIHNLSGLTRALELYRVDHGAYPNTPTGVPDHWFSYVLDGSDADPAATAGDVIASSDYIPGLAPEYYKDLPT